MVLWKGKKPRRRRRKAKRLTGNESPETKGPLLTQTDRNDEQDAMHYDEDDEDDGVSAQGDEKEYEEEQEERGQLALSSPEQGMLCIQCALVLGG